MKAAVSEMKTQLLVYWIAHYKRKLVYEGKSRAIDSFLAVGFASR